MVPKLSENIGFDITVVSPSGKPSILKDVANGLEKLANSKCLVNESCLTSFALRFSDTLRVADATSANLGKALTLLIPKILLVPHHIFIKEPKTCSTSIILHRCLTTLSHSRRLPGHSCLFRSARQPSKHEDGTN
jgi:hypothetical protein